MQISDYPKLQNKRVLVTGGAGFIGSNLCGDLLKQGNEVVCLDNFSTGRIENIKEFLACKEFKLVPGDIRNLEDCRKAADGIDIIFHEAALGSVPRSVHDPITSNSVNISGFLNMLVAARDAKVNRFIYAASSSAYGDSMALPKVEDVTGKPISPYAVTKYTNELYAHVFGLNYGLDIIGLRYFNVYGPKQDPNGAYAAVIPKFTASLMAHRPPVIYGDGSHSRDFTYVENVIQMNHLAAVTRNREAMGQVFNTGVGECNDLNSLVRYLKKYLCSYDPEIADIEVKYESPREGDIPHSLASIDKAAKMLGYSPRYDLEQGLKLAVGWYWENLQH